MDLELKNKIALVTASSDGIGFAIAKALAAEGAQVYVNGRSRERVNEAIDKIKQEYPQAQVYPAAFDIGTKSGADQLIQTISSLDILVNNLGIYEVKSFETISDEDWFKLFEVNVLSGIRLSRHYFPLMKEQNWGRIIFISSESAIQIPSEMIHYGMTKTAQLSISRGLAELTVGTNVTVNSVLPGPTYSKGVKQFITEIAKDKAITPEKAEEEFFQTARPSSLIQRFASIEEVAALVAFVCSPLASAVNGASLRVDGGVVRSII